MRRNPRKSNRSSRRTEDSPSVGFSTLAIHAGQEPDPTTGSIMTPVHLTSTYVQPELGKHKGYVYSRVANPTRTVLEKNIAALEYVDTTALHLVRKTIRPNTRMLFIETPTNPTMEITDLRGVVRIATERGLLTVVDNTFATPCFQKPLKCGVDIVVHSATKYLNGHSDMVGGVVVVNSDKLNERLRFIQKSVGGVMSPFDAWLCLRGTKTLAVRMEKHTANALQVANFLERHPKVKRVLYPGLPSHPQHQLGKKQMQGFGGMISFDLGNFPTAKKFLRNVRLCALAESLGGVETLISHPATMTHASVPPEQRKRIGITDGLVRISVGIEDVQDIIQDLQQAFST